MGKRKLTMKEVADEAGVSVSTVSLVFSGRGRVSKEVREKILEVTERLGYQRRMLPAALPSQGKAVNLGILLHLDYEYLWYFFQPTIATIDSVVAQNGYNLLIIPVEFRMDPQKVLHRIVTSGVRAIFSIHYADRELFAKLESMGIPVVLLHNHDFQDRFFTVSFDDLQGSYEGALHLIRLGHRNLGYVEFAHRDLFALRKDRFYGFMKALEENGIVFDPSNRVSVSFSNPQEMPKKLRARLEREPRVTALFVHDDYLAMKVVAGLSTLGLSVPKDISLIAPGDVLDYREPMVPPISTMKINTALIGKIAAEMMLHRFAANPPDIQVLKIKEQFIDRGSCRPLQA